MSVSTTAATALIVGASLSGVASNVRIEALFVLTFLVGAFQLLAGLLKLGRFTRFVSNAVMTGFLSGVAVLIILGQLWFHRLQRYWRQHADANARSVHAPEPD
ncbi:MAG: SulP family inorganic anion transporter [Halobacteriota archaeon]